MGIHTAKQLASLAQGQAEEAVYAIQRSGVETDMDKYHENLALALASLSQSFTEFLKDQ